LGAGLSAGATPGAFLPVPDELITPNPA